MVNAELQKKLDFFEENKGNFVTFDYHSVHDSTKVTGVEISETKNSRFGWIVLDSNNPNVSYLVSAIVNPKVEGK